ncbi:MAG: peptidase M14 [Acidobacteria bacterium]|nr:MAG: peptidase M14 [Acidobacteriota bacterium]
MRPRVFVLVLVLCAVWNVSSQSQVKTRAERTNYIETSRYDDVVTFLNTVGTGSPLIHITTFGYTFEGRALPVAIVGRIQNATPQAIRASRRLRVYIQANIHAGEVEGKEAAQILVREIASGKHAQWLDSMILLIAPIYNADGNERVSLTNRGPQNGPIGGMGIRANAQGLNINRDNIKLDTPEARSMVKLLNDYDPHIMIDLHTTDGSRHAYHLTWEAPNNPAVDPNIAKVARDEWMPAVMETIKRKDGWALHSYGDVDGQPPERVWTTVEDLPRYTHKEEVLNFSHANAVRIRRVAEDADARSLVGQRLSLRSRVKRSDVKAEILMGDTEEEVHPFSGQTMLRRLDVRKPEQMWLESTFESTESERVPSAYYIPAVLTAAIERLRAHGIRLESLDQSTTVPLEEFRIDSTQVAAQTFESHQERTVTGKYQVIERTIPAGTYRVSMKQPLARLAFYLIEPRSNDGLLNWNFLDDALKDSKTYPITRSRD